MTDFAYLEHNQIHVNAGGTKRTVSSTFGEKIRMRAVELERRHSWKTQGRGAQFMSGGALWGQRQGDAAEIPMFLNGLSRGCAKDEIIYSLSTHEISGVFRLKEYGAEEQRLLHTNDYRVTEVGGGAHGVACAFNRKNGTSSLAVMQPNGEGLQEITQGDTTDLCPSFVPGRPTELVYQSAGVARTDTGVAAGLGPFRIEKVDFEAGVVETVAEDEKFDLLNPRYGDDGSLYFIRRPYVGMNVKMSPWKMALEFVMLPFNILFAIFQFVNFFTASYTGKFLTSATGARQREADMQQMMVWGNLVEATKKSKAANGADGGLVPTAWELIRKRGGAEEVLAKGVLSFDLGSDGEVVYTNGRFIYAIGPDNKKRSLAEGKMIRQVIAL